MRDTDSTVADNPNDPHGIGQYSETSSALDDVIQRVLADGGTEDEIAVLVRRKRNMLLAQSDTRMNLDRLNLTMPKSILFTDWLQFFKQIAELLTGDWAQYRQALRDIPQQEGFPLNVVWPEEPEE